MILAIGAAFCRANPHVYMDTLGLIGAVSTGFAASPARPALGAVAASFTFFLAIDRH